MTADDRKFWANGLREHLAPEFVRRDRRKMIGMPDANADEWIEAQFGSWSDPEVVAVRGDRRDGSAARRTLRRLTGTVVGATPRP
jgi:hypothetical protein